MKIFSITTCFLFTIVLVHAQMKYLGEPGITHSTGSNGIVNPRLVQHQSRPLLTTNKSLQTLVPLHLQDKDIPPGVKVVYDVNERPIALFESQASKMPCDMQRSVESAKSYLVARASVLQLHDPESELELMTVQVDVKRNAHLKYQQVFKGWEIYGSELVVHTRNDYFNSITGRWRETPQIETDRSILSIDHVREVIHTILDIQEIDDPLKMLVPREQMIVKKIIFYPEDAKTPILAFHVDVYPDPATHWQFILNAEDGSVLRQFEDICKFYHDKSSCPPVLNSAYAPILQNHTMQDVNNQLLFMDGDVTAIQQDLAGTNRTIHNFQIGTNFFMIDVSRSMYNDLQSNMPDEPEGVLWTLDANGTSPQNENFTVAHAQSTNNTWLPLEVSAHWNSGTAYEYFLSAHGRNSISGNGGNIISLINVRDENGNEMDNAFWNGYAMFYGNGDQAFDQPLARALDVAGHEMSHGVIQNTANLEYVGQSGALNESYADIFGAMIDRADWQMGEDVVNTGIFSSGALRDLSDPHNGGNSDADPGWQPAHMNEFVNLPNTPEGDNGGVHVNSGIVNRAFFLFATQVAKDVAEDVYYHALSNYLVKSSQFIDARLAIINSAEDLFPSQPQIATAAATAFSTVGIGTGEGGSYEENIDTNPGQDFVLLTDNDLSSLYIYDPLSGDISELDAPAPLSRPSVSDDGSIAVYVDEQQTLKAITFDWSGAVLDYEVVDLESNPQSIWRNIAISKDGERIAFLTEDLDNLVYVYDFSSQQEESFELYNPTTGSGVSTGGVLYADVMEWDYSGEYVMYDALNEINGNFGDGIRYWDISFIRVWDNVSDDFTFGQIDKLFTNLPENVSVGNATFSKNSPHIIAFDFFEEVTDIFGDVTTDYFLLTANLESSRIVTVFQNDALAYPSYSRLDDLILFDSKDPQDKNLLLTAFIEMQPQDIMSPVPNSAAILINGGHLATWSSTGSRNLSSIDSELQNDRLCISPNPTSDEFSIEILDYSGLVELSLCNHIGQVVRTKQSNIKPGEKASFDVYGLPGGAYLLQAITEEGQYSGQIIIQR